MEKVIVKDIVELTIEQDHTLSLQCLAYIKDYFPLALILTNQKVLTTFEIHYDSIVTEVLGYLSSIYIPHTSMPKSGKSIIEMTIHISAVV